MKVVLDHAEDVANHCTTFWFQCGRPFEYIAGQFIEMTLPHPHSDDRGQKRWFTLSSSPTEGLISITTKRALANASTFKKCLFNLAVGAEVAISEAMGDFVLPKDPSIPLYFIAGGIGITPVRSMVKWLLDKKQSRKVHILYAAHKLEDLAFLDIFKTYGATLQIVLSAPPVPWQGQIGTLSKGVVLKFYPGKHARVYVSGPEQMVEMLESDLLTSGILPGELVLDFFQGYGNM